MKMPPELTKELNRMRRNPADFLITREGISCALSPSTKIALKVSHVSRGEAGTWCPEHGWLSFNSTEFPPTERLKAWEIEEQRLAAKRRVEFVRRKQAENV